MLRCGVFLQDIGEFERMNAVYARMFGDHRPARTTVQVANLPQKGLRVEIDAIGYVPVTGVQGVQEVQEVQKVQSSKGSRGSTTNALRLGNPLNPLEPLEPA